MDALLTPAGREDEQQNLNVIFTSNKVMCLSACMSVCLLVKKF